MKREEFEKRRQMLKSSDNLLHQSGGDERKPKKKTGEVVKQEWSRHIVTNDVSYYVFIHFFFCNVYAKSY